MHKLVFETEFFFKLIFLNISIWKLNTYYSSDDGMC